MSKPITENRSLIERLRDLQPAPDGRDDVRFKNLTAERKQPEELGARTIRFTASTATEDRDGDVVKPGGIQTSRYAGNPTVLFAHQHREPPIGRAVNWFTADGAFKVDIQFDEDERSTAFLKKVRDEGSLNAVSIGFQPIDVREGEEVDGFIFQRVELLEVSLVTVPSNPDAVADERSKALRIVGQKLTGAAKEGRVLSKRNVDRIKGAMSGLDAVLAEQSEEDAFGIEADGTHSDDGKMTVSDSVKKQLSEADAMELSGILDAREARLAQMREILQADAVFTSTRQSKFADLIRADMRQSDRMLELIGATQDEGDDKKALAGVELKGQTLGETIEQIIESESTDDRPASDIRGELAQQAGRDRSTISDIITGEIQCPPFEVLEAFAEVLQVETDTLVEAAEEDGCEYDTEENALIGCRVTSTKTATDFLDLPLAARDREWDSEAAVGRWRSFSGSEDEPSERYRNNFMWFDSENPQNFTSYKLPYGDIIDGSHVAVPRAVFAVAAALQGARGGVELPDEDRPKVETHVEQYYAKMRDEFDDDSLVAPWNSEDDFATWRSRQADALGLSGSDAATIAGKRQTVVRLAGDAPDEDQTTDDDSETTPEALRVIGLQ